MSCFLIEIPLITVVYVHVPGHGVYLPKTKRFVEGYQQFPAGVSHKMIVVSQGREPYPDVVEILKGLGPHEVVVHDNSAWDIGAFKKCARERSSPMMMFLSGGTYLRGPNWLKRAWDVFQQYDGYGLFGACGNTGGRHIDAWPHIRTSSFWCAPEVLLRYPYQCEDMYQRYPMEHGPSNFTLWCRSMGLPTVVVDFTSHHEFGHWMDNPNGFHQGYQRDLLLGDRHTEPPDYPYP